jgi:magnesium chelatase family protein
VLASVRSAVLEGVEGRLVTVEVHVSRGLPGYTIVGLPDASGKESRERVRAAVLSSGLAYPQQRVTVNLAPASVRKSGAGLELAVAVGLLAAAGSLPEGALGGVAVLGELGLDGRVRPVVGALGLVSALSQAGVSEMIVPLANASEAALAPDVKIRVARTLGELRACLCGDAPWPDPPDPPTLVDGAIDQDDPCDLADVLGLSSARYALSIAAAGAHHALLVGPPGIGKTMLARRMPTIMPPLTATEALEVAKVHSAAGSGRGAELRIDPPFRAPHHSASTAALIGGGSARVRPGECSLAHRGVLFLDEVPEFPTAVLESLRQPLEERVVRVSRASGTITFPADFLLIACANSCPCGRAAYACRCNDAQRARYARRLSAPLLDRFDLRLEIKEMGKQPGESSAEVATRVAAAVERQRARLTGTPWRRNAHIPAGALERLIPLPIVAEAGWRRWCEARQLTGRGAARVRRFARTIADLDDRAHIEEEDVSDAVYLREDLWKE